MDSQTLVKYEAMEKLCLTTEEREFALGAINVLEKSFQKLSAFDAKDASPLTNVVELENVLRDDISKKTISRDELLSNAPDEFFGYFQVPKALD
jgi:aspartyl-tRNA(Asn)/glutamyl-tRNA(Gln) amidotransferase subunit C